MTLNKPDNVGDYDYLKKLWADRLNQGVLKKSGEDFQASVELMNYKVLELSGSRERLEEALTAEVRALRIERETITEQNVTMRAELEAERAKLQAALQRLSKLEKFLTKAMKRPWRPMKEALRRKAAQGAAVLAAPISKRHAKKFAASARKRDPNRFLDRSIINEFDTRKYDGQYEIQSKEILTKFFPKDYIEPPKSLHMRLGSGALVRKYLEGRVVRPNPSPTFRRHFPS